MKNEDIIYQNGQKRLEFEFRLNMRSVSHKCINLLNGMTYYVGFDKKREKHS